MERELVMCPPLHTGLTCRCRGANLLVAAHGVEDALHGVLRFVY